MTHSENADQIQTPSTKKRRGRWFWPSVVLILASGGGVMLMANQFPPAPIAATPVAPVEAPTMRLNALEVVTLEPRRMEQVVRVTGTIHPAQEAAVSAQVSGQADAVLVQPGEQVNAGDLLVEVGTADLQLLVEQQKSTIASSEVQLRAAQTTLDRTLQLSERGLTPQTTLDSAQSSVDQLTASMATQQTQLTQAEINLQRARVTAPFAGTIATRDIEPGQSVNSGTTLFSIVDLSTVRVEVIAPLKDAPSLVVGQTVRLGVQGMNGQGFSGTIDRINPVAEAGTRSIRVYLSLDNASGQLRGGMFVTGEIVVAQQDDVLAVPTEAVLEREAASYVMAVVDGVLQEIPIETGTRWARTELVEARAGLAAGDVIVGTQLSGLANGDAVIIEGN